MLNRKKLHRALRELDAAACADAVGSAGLRDATSANEFLDELRQADCLLLRRPDARRESRRDSLMTKCRELLVGGAPPEAVSAFEAHVADATIAERGFRAILASVASSPVSGLHPDAQAWGFVRWSEGVLGQLAAELDKQIATAAATGKPFDARQLRLTGDGGSQITPDAFLDGTTRSLGSTLLMMGYVHEWFDASTGILVVPPEPPRDPSAICACAALFALSTAWRELGKVWDRCRLLGGGLCLRHGGDANGVPRDAEVISGPTPGAEEMYDRVATNRLISMHFGRMMDITTKGIGHGAVQSPDKGAVPLPPGAFISIEELVAAGMLAGTFCLPMDDDAQLFEGLPLRVWLRGYAYCAYMAASQGKRSLHSLLTLNEKDLRDGLANVGLSTCQAERFLELTSFQKNSLDLYDAPILRSSDGSLLFWAPAYTAPVIEQILLSRIGSLNRRRGDDGEIMGTCTFEDKGRRFEAQCLRAFQDVGVPARSFRYTVDGVQYDCDVAVLLDQTLFVFECKNHAIPLGHLPSLYYHLVSMDSAGRQAQRIADQMDAHPEIARQQFGSEAVWARTVPCVLQALPWSAGELGAVFFYDSSALFRFLGDGTVCVTSVSPVEGSHVLRRHNYPLRKGPIPTADELLRQLREPCQLKVEALGWQQVTSHISLSTSLFMERPEWRQRPTTVEERMVALGSTPAEASRMARDLTEEFPAAMEDLKGEIAARHAAKRQ